MKYALLLILFTDSLFGLAFTSEDTVFTPDTGVLHDFIARQIDYKKYRGALLEMDSIYTVAEVKIKGKHVTQVDFCCSNLESLQEGVRHLIMLTDGKWKSGRRADQHEFTLFIPIIGINAGVFYSRQAYQPIKEKIESAEPLQACKKKKNCYVYHTIFWITYPTVHKESAGQ